MVQEGAKDQLGLRPAQETGGSKPCTFAGKKMKLLPFQTFDVCVKLPPWEVCRRLLDNIGGASSFHGEVQEGFFKIYRNIIYSDPFLPRLHGVLEAVDGGTQVKINMKMFLPTKVWILFCSAMTIGLSVLGNLNNKVGFCILGFIIVITYVVFRFETKESRAAFLNFFETKIAANQEDAPA